MRRCWWCTRQAGGVDEGVPRAQDPGDHVEVTAPGQGSAGVERLVEAAHGRDHLLSVAHVAARPEHPGAVRVEGVAGQDRSGVPGRRPGPAEAAVLLEGDLRGCLELERQHLAGDPSGIGVHGPHLGQGGVPARVHDDVVVEEGHDVAAGGSEGEVAREGESRPRLHGVAHARSSCDGGACLVVRRCVVHDEDVGPGHSGPVDGRLDAAQAGQEQVGTVPRAHGDGEGVRARRRVPPQLVEDRLPDECFRAGGAGQEVYLVRFEAGAGGQYLQHEPTGRPRRRTTRPTPSWSGRGCTAGIGASTSTSRSAYAIAAPRCTPDFTHQSLGRSRASP